jgi:hypothetical protein
MFTESLMLLELASVDEKRRTELIVGWTLASLADLEGIMLEAQARGNDRSRPLTAIRTRRASIEGYARHRQARTRRWRVDEKLADRHLDGEGYLDFRLAHHFVHGSSFASKQRLSWHEKSTGPAPCIHRARSSTPGASAAE